MGWLDGKKIVDALYGDSYTPLIQKIYKGDELIFERKDPWIEEDLFHGENITGSGSIYDTGVKFALNSVVGKDICHGFGIEFSINSTDPIITLTPSASASTARATFFFSTRGGARPYIQLAYNNNSSPYGSIPAKSLYTIGGSGSGLNGSTAEIELDETYKIEYLYNTNIWTCSDSNGSVLWEYHADAEFQPTTNTNDRTSVLFGTSSDMNSSTARTSGTLNLFRLYRIVDSE